MIDFEHAKQVFDDYVKDFDITNDKIHLKVVHTYGVVTAAEYLANKLALSEEDTQLALMIALLHDIGRFEQLKRFNSFDDRLVDHALLGADLLEQGLLKDFLPMRDYDELILTAIRNHSTYAIDPTVTGQALLHTQIIRDADKLDNYRVKETEAFETLFDLSQAELEAQTITPIIFDEFSKEHLIKKADRRTSLDMWLSYIAFMFDLNFAESRQFLLDKNYIPILFGRLTPVNPETQRQYVELQKVAEAFVS